MHFLFFQAHPCAEGKLVLPLIQLYCFSMLTKMKILYPPDLDILEQPIKKGAPKHYTSVCAPALILLKKKFMPRILILGRFT